MQLLFSVSFTDQDDKTKAFKVFKLDDPLTLQDL